VENFVSAFTAFDGSVDELKHKPVAQRNAAKKFVDLKIGRSHLRLSMLILLCAMKNLFSCTPG
jgi:hypothetical protein